MSKPKRKYWAFLTNGTGASQDVPMQTYNLTELKKHIRANYTGFTAHIMAIDLDGDGQSTMGEAYEAETFKLRGA